MRNPLTSNETIIEFYERKFGLSDLIKKLGRQNTIFEIRENGISKYYIICDRNETQRYNGTYKIYLLSTDLTDYQDFYISDLESIIRCKTNYDIHYRWDLINK